MKNNKILLAILAIALVFGLVGCDNGGGGGTPTTTTKPNTDPKLITITGIPSGTMETYKTKGAYIGLIPAGTDLSAILSLETQKEKEGAIMPLLRAYTIIDTTRYGSWLATLDNSFPDCNLWDPTNNSANRWTGTGTFDVILSDPELSTSPYRANSVAFSATTTTVAWSKFTAVN
jgi:hypothetical protein